MLIQLRLAELATHSKFKRDPLSIALGMLLRAHRYARNMRASRWQFAVELEEFLQSGVGRSDLRWLLLNGLVLHAQEVINPSSIGRQFIRLPKHMLPPRTCFVLSDTGVLELEKPASHRSRVGRDHFGMLGQLTEVLSNDASELGNLHRTPCWDQGRRELRLDGIVVKRFRSPAANQVAILSAFQEEAWSERIDDPLPPVLNQDPRRRLSDAIKFLNRNQLKALLRFRGDGTGKGVLWEPREEAPAAEA